MLETIDWMIGDASKHVAQIEFWIKSIELLQNQQLAHRKRAVMAVGRHLKNLQMLFQASGYAIRLIVSA